jgi:hypothetical protein
VPFVSIVLLRLFFNYYYKFDVADYQLSKTLTFDINYLLKGVIVISEELIKGLFKNLILLISYIFIILNFFSKKKNIFYNYQLVQSLFFIIFLYGAFLFNVPDVEWQTKVAIDRVLFLLSGSLLISFNYYLARGLKS